MTTALLFLALACFVAHFIWRHFFSPQKTVLAAAREILSGAHPIGLAGLRGSHAIHELGWTLEKISAEQQRLRQHVAEAEFNHRAILSSMVEGVMVVDRHHVIQSVNESFLQFFQMEQSPLGQTALQALREASVEETLRSALQSGERQLRHISVSRRSGDSCDFAVSAAPLRSAEGGTSGVVAVFHDVSRVRRLEEVRREFVANVSHELRTPLAILSGYLENLVDDPRMARKEQAEIFHTMEKHAGRLRALLDDLLTLARLETRGEALLLEEIRLEAFLGQMARDWANALGRKKITLALDLPPGLPPLTADAFRMQQVFNNLLDNAVKYTPENGAVIITAEAAGPMMRIRVQDNGQGIPQQALPHIFERFYRADKARSRAAGGTGLGLSIVKHIAQLHGGAVTAESVYGKWTAIILTLPVRQPAGSAESNGAEPELFQDAAVCASAPVLEAQLV